MPRTATSHNKLRTHMGSHANFDVQVKVFVNVFEKVFTEVFVEMFEISIIYIYMYISVNILGPRVPWASQTRPRILVPGCSTATPVSWAP